MPSGAVLGTSSIAICVPLVLSKAASFCSRPVRWMSSSVPVWSMTCAVSAGTGNRSWARANGPATRAQARTRSLSTRLPPCRAASLLLAAEVDLWRRRDLLLVLHREAGLGLVAEHLGSQVGREAAREHVVLLHGLDVAVARDGDAVLRAFELHAQVAEALVGLEVRIAFAHHHQPAERAREFAL